MRDGIDLRLAKEPFDHNVAFCKSLLHVPALVYHRRPAFFQSDDVAESSELIGPDVTGLELMTFRIMEYRSGRSRLHSGFGIMDRGQDLVSDANRSNRFFGNIPIFRRHGRHRVADETDLFIERIDFILIRAEKHLGNVLVRNDRGHARHFFRRGRVHGDNSCVGMRASEDLHPQHVRQD